jgi:predicted MFS family arabinose efflux permease
MDLSTRRTVSIAVGGLVALAAAMGIGRFVYTPILPYMDEGLGLTKAQAGLIASANFLGYLLGALSAAAVALPGGRRAWLLAALAASALLTGAMGLVGSLPAFLLLRLAGGIASAFVLVLSSAIVLDRLSAARRGGLSAVHFAGVGCGIALSAVLVAGLGAAGISWRGQWLASGGLSLLALAAAAVLIPGEVGIERPAPPTASIERRGGLIALIVAYGLFGFGYVITATFINTLVRSSAELRAVEPFIWLVVGLMAIPSVGLWTWVGARLGNGRAIAVACVVEALGVAMSVLVSSGLAVVVAGALLGGTFMGITALGLVHARRLSQGDPRRIIALMTAAFGLGQMIGPSFAGIVHDIAGGFLVPSLTAALALLVAAGLVVDWRTWRGQRGEVGLPSD